MKNKKTPSFSRKQLARFHKIALAIKEGDYPNCKDLAPQFGVCRETISRDITMMINDLDYPIEYDQRRYGYYFTRDFTPLSAQKVNEQEILALHFLESACELLRGTPAGANLKTAFQKVMASVTCDRSVYPKRWRDVVHFRSAIQNLFDPDIFEALFQAGGNRERIIIKYRKPGVGQPVEDRDIDPYNLVNVNGEWYLFAYDHGRKAVRTFVPSRIKSITKTGKKFRPIKGYSVEKRLSNCFGIHGGGERIEEVKIEFSPNVADHIREKRYGGQQNVHELPNGGVQLDLQLSSLVEIHRWILNWGGEATAIHPPQLSEMLVASARKILEAHEKQIAPTNRTEPLAAGQPVETKPQPINTVME